MKIRLDQYLCQNGLAQSRERAKALIMAGIVYVGEEKSDKPGNMVDENAHVEVRGHDIRYVSRGGLKLEKAMQVFPLTPEGKVCMDIGASTGGFTDCMLQNGAVKVYAVDVGYGQLAWTLRCDKRVVNMERTNIRHVTAEQLQEPVAFFSVDVSFISLKHIFPVAAAITAPEAVLPYLEQLDMVLVMTVEPGFGGQAFMEHQLDTIRRVRAFIDQYNPACDLEVDGGINPVTAKKVVEAGANVLVAGSAVYGAPDISLAIASLRGEA